MDASEAQRQLDLVMAALGRPEGKSALDWAHHVRRMADAGEAAAAERLWRYAVIFVLGIVIGDAVDLFDLLTGWNAWGCH